MFIGEPGSDISYINGAEKFNFRVCAVIIEKDSILAMHDERSPYFYLPGGRVKFGETSEQAIIRELKEELHTNAEIIRPLWLNQGFFKEDVDHLNYHELCMYFLVDILKEDIPIGGEKFSLKEGDKTNRFQWLKFESLKDEYFYPLFLKEEIFNLPEKFTLRTERE